MLLQINAVATAVEVKVQLKSPFPVRFWLHYWFQFNTSVIPP